MNYDIIKYVYLTNDHKQTFHTIHKVNDKLIDKPYKLQITKYPNYEGFYLIYLDKNGEEITDTYHENIEDAMNQAEWEFGINKKDWVES